VPTLGIALPVTVWEAHRLRDRLRGD
jgi:hypothetical protein